MKVLRTSVLGLACATALVSSVGVTLVGGTMFAVGLMGGLMPRWCGEAGGSPALSRNRDHHLCGSRGTRSRGGGVGFRRGLRGRHRRVNVCVVCGIPSGRFRGGTR